MGFKVLNGYRLRCASPFEFIAEHGGTLELSFERMVRRLVAKEAAALIDGAVDAGEGPASRFSAQPLVWAAWRVEAETEEAARTLRRLPLDVAFSLLFLSDRGRLFALLYCEQDEMTAAFARLDGVEHWPFFDSDDRPAEVSETEWDLRRDVWRRLLPDAPSRCGVSWEPFPTSNVLSMSWDLSTLLLFVPSAHSRAVRVARRLAADEIAAAAARDGGDVVQALLSPAGMKQLSGRTVELTGVCEQRLPKLSAKLFGLRG